MTIYLWAVFLFWWLGGIRFAIWAWTERYDEIDPGTVFFAVFGCILIGPIMGLLWWPQKKHPLWKRKKS